MRSPGSAQLQRKVRPRAPYRLRAQLDSPFSRVRRPATPRNRTTMPGVPRHGGSARTVEGLARGPQRPSGPRRTPVGPRRRPNDSAQPRRGPSEPTTHANTSAPVVGCSAWFGLGCHQRRPAPHRLSIIAPRRLRVHRPTPVLAPRAACRTTQLSRGGGDRADEPRKNFSPRRRLQRLVRPRLPPPTTRPRQIGRAHV